MRIYHSWEEVILYQPPIMQLAIGNFDGVHLGHQTFLNMFQSGNSGVITFWPHPRSVVQNETKIGYIQSLAQRIKTLEDVGIEYLIVIPFNEEMAKKGSDEFLEQLRGLKSLQRILLGYDSSIGNERTYDEIQLKNKCLELGFKLIRGRQFSMRNGQTFLVPSSRAIRESLQAGNLGEVALMMGREYDITGTVIGGKGLGRKLGFPTANLQCAGLTFEEMALPLYGVYLVVGCWENREEVGVANLGTVPSVGKGKIELEVHFLHLSQSDLYGKEIRFIFKKFIRAEREFASLDELCEQITRDVRVAEKLAKEVGIQKDIEE